MAIYVKNNKIPVAVRGSEILWEDIKNRPVIDTALDANSSNAVENKAIYAELKAATEKLEKLIRYTEIEIVSSTSSQTLEVGDTYHPNIKIQTNKTPKAVYIKVGSEKIYEFDIQVGQNIFNYITNDNITTDVTYTVYVEDIDLKETTVTKISTVKIQFKYKLYYVFSNSPVNIPNTYTGISSNMQYTYNNYIKFLADRKYIYFAVIKNTNYDIVSGTGEPLNDFFEFKGEYDTTIGGGLSQIYNLYMFHLLSDESLDENITITLK